MIRLGATGHEQQFPMRVYENDVFNRGLKYECPIYEPFPEPFDAILGQDFIEELQIRLGFCSGCEMRSPICGHICNGLVRKFEPKSFRSTDYSRDLDGRIILLFDMDCFEVQVHEKPHQRGLPRVVVNSSDRILAVSYEAKQLGISRAATPYLRQAMAKCHDLIPIYVPIYNQASNLGRPRPDSSIARAATRRIVEAIKSCIPEGSTFQFSSGDEFYVDITQYVNKKEKENDLFYQMHGLWPNTFLYNDAVSGEPSREYVRRRLATLKRKNAMPIGDQELRLIYGACVASRIVNEILKQTTYQSSVGVGSKKLISKIASGLHKPGSVTILTPSGLDKFSQYVKIENIPGLGGKFGQSVKYFFHATTMADLQNIHFDDLQNIVGEKKATEFLNSAFGIDDELVKPVDGFKTCSTIRKLDGDYYSASEIKHILRDQIDETLKKIAEAMEQNPRVLEKVKMSIKVNNGDNLNSTVVLGCYPDLPDREQLYQRICSNCKPPFSQWNPKLQVDNLSIVGHFSEFL